MTFGNKAGNYKNNINPLKLTIMNENKFTEKESLELISSMIQQTRQNISSGSGNDMIYYGYVVLILSVAVFALTHYTRNDAWSALWFLMFAAWGIKAALQKKHKPTVVTYVDKAIGNTWRVMGMMFVLTPVAILLTGLAVGVANFTIMMPLCLLYAAIGTAITGVIIKENSLIFTPVIAVMAAVFMLVELSIGHGFAKIYHLLFGLSFLIMELIPGYLLNSKAK